MTDAMVKGYADVEQANWAAREMAGARLFCQRLPQFTVHRDHGQDVITPRRSVAVTFDGELTGPQVRPDRVMMPRPPRPQC